VGLVRILIRPRADFRGGEAQNAECSSDGIDDQDIRLPRLPFAAGGKVAVRLFSLHFSDKWLMRIKPSCVILRHNEQLGVIIDDVMSAKILSIEQVIRTYPKRRP
jgi:hypothetical protein